MNIFVTGATGFTGSHVVPLLLKHGYKLRCLYRSTSDRTLCLDAARRELPSSELEWSQGDLSDTQALSASLRGTDILVNIASLGFGHAESIIRAAKDAGVKRAIFISTTAIFTQLNANSKIVRTAAEQAITTSGLDYTILRPTMIYGTPRDRNMWRLIRLVRRLPVIPIFGDGKYLQQPIHVGDVAAAVLGCVQTSATIGKAYNIAGAHPLTYNDVVDTIATALHKRVFKAHIPAAPVVAMLKLFERLKLPFPIKAEQVLRLNEDKAFEYTEAQRDFGFRPISFAEGIAKELE